MHENGTDTPLLNLDIVVRNFTKVCQYLFTYDLLYCIYMFLVYRFFDGIYYLF